MTKVFRIDINNIDEDAIRECCEIVLSGGIVVFPTETVYGLGASAFNGEAVKKVFIAKNRPMDNPLIVHISNKKQLYEVADEIPEKILKAVEILWPGPFTLLLKKGSRVASEATANLPTVAVRIPAHPVALKLIDCTGPIAAPSANISGRPSPTTGFHVMVDMFGRANAIIDSGETIYGVESTIVDATTKPMKLLRPGAMPIEKISEALGEEIIVTQESRGLAESEKALAPGMKYKHYSPETPIILVEYSNQNKMVSTVTKIAEELKKAGRRIAVIASTETANMYTTYTDKIIVYGSRKNIFEIAKNLFKILRELDREGVEIAIAEGVEEKGLGLAVMNRLRKASTKIVK
ncbi:L-threonylcarbamoyladenylate synthase [Ignisphaera sp. 4213-co]|uniref:Threonylcarbamoyl-AMP synthase n=1 Tax=Ignisphaera cupida TaxID=3050454 RepID=A0ABD4Z6Q5_9CREN|nr:L-threonylcarbamoyladenylate synthase [Ignisphaera sp. 4213-co]MDK6028677.1 L-threonylcarbamoyladenylate synthase [Ignisphaera sp. 4213-co]